MSLRRVLVALAVALPAPALAHAVEEPSLALLADDPLPEGAVVVTGTRTPRTVRDAPVRTDVISRATLEGTAARTLADALDYLPGARAESNCQNCNTTEIQLLGCPAPTTRSCSTACRSCPGSPPFTAWSRSRLCWSSRSRW